MIDVLLVLVVVVVVVVVTRCLCTGVFYLVVKRRCHHSMSQISVAQHNNNHQLDISFLVILLN